MEDEMNKFQEMLNNKAFINKLEQKMRYFSSFLSTKNSNQLLFNRYKYNQDMIKNINKEKIVWMFISFINKLNEISKHKNSNDILFISNIISKLYNENIITKEDLLIISKHILSLKKFESFFEIIYLTQVPDIFYHLKNINLSKLDKINIRKILSSNPKYLKSILSCESKTTEFNPNKFISSLFALKFNLNLLSISDLLINEYKYSNNNPFPNKY